MTKKIIGIVGWKTGENSFGITIPYAEYFSQFGEIQILSPSFEAKKLDLLVLPGGPDLSPSEYGQIPNFRTGNNDVMKEFFFRNTLKEYIGNTPIYATCLGMQMLNVYFGGTLTQHYDFPYSSPRHELVEKLILTEEGKKEFTLPKDYKINSLHHQGIFDEDLSSELIALGHSNYKNVELAKHHSLPIYMNQGHSEETWCSLNSLIIKKLLCVD